MNRNDRIAVAQQTLEYFKNREIAQSEFLTEESIKKMSLPAKTSTPEYKVLDESVIDTVFRLRHIGNVGVLNFASAKNPGGGFLNGAVAQEESLAISSDLYLSQLKSPNYYAINKNCKTMLYTNNTIYSKSVTFIRDSNYRIVKEPAQADVLTCPAVNAGEYYKKEKGTRDKVYQEMLKRIRYILTIFANKNNNVIILGAFGCGVFRNDPQDVADIFFRLLKLEGYEKYFEQIYFSILNKDSINYKAFSKKFK